MEKYNLVHYKEVAIRVAEDETSDSMLYSIVDIVSLLTRSTDARKYWNTLKQRLSKTDPDLIARCRQASLPARDGKRRMTDVAEADVIMDLLKVIPGIDESEVNSFVRWIHRGGRMHDVVLPFKMLPFQPGSARVAVNTIHDDDLRQMAEAEYQYYTGNAQKAADIAGLYLDHGEINIRITAAHIYVLACMHLRRHVKSMAAFQILENSLQEAMEYHSPKIQRIARMMLFSARVILHMPTDEMEHDITQLVPELPEGLKTWACSIYCYALYREKKYEQILGVVEATNAFTSDVYPVPLGYLNAFAAIALVNQRRMEEAEEYLDRVMELCQPDGLFEILAEMQLMLHGMVDVYIKPRAPEDASPIDAIASEFYSGWMEMRELLSEHSIPLNVNKTEFIMAVLASRGWKNKEIADYLGFSQNTVKKYLSNVFEKLHADNRRDLRRILMQ